MSAEIVRGATDYFRDHYSQLIGATVTKVGKTKANDAEFRYEDEYHLVLKAPNGKTIVASILCDPEGNGPGFLDIGRE